MDRLESVMTDFIYTVGSIVVWMFGTAIGLTVLALVVKTWVEWYEALQHIRQQRKQHGQS
jgi:hypothetical protein